MIQFDGNGKKSGMPGTVLAGVTTSSKKEAEDGRANVIPFRANTFLPFHSEFNQIQKAPSAQAFRGNLRCFPSV